MRPTFGCCRRTVAGPDGLTHRGVGCVLLLLVRRLERLRLRVRHRGGHALAPMLHLLHRLGVVEELHHVVFDSLPHVFEERIALTFVLDQRIPLTIGPQPDSFAEVVEGEQVVLPLPIDGIEQQESLETRKALLAELLDPLIW